MDRNREEKPTRYRSTSDLVEKPITVQHERGPRKPKVKDHHQQMDCGMKSMNPNLPSLHQNPHHSHLAAVSYAAAKQFSLFEHQRSVMSKLPPPLISSSQQEQLEEMFAPKVSESSGGSGPFMSNCRPNSSGSFLDGVSSSTPPGLLQMLLNAEKSQELIWSSIRCAGLQAGMPPAAHMSASFPYGPPPPLPLSVPFMTSNGCPMMQPSPQESSSSPDGSGDSKSSMGQRQHLGGLSQMGSGMKFSSGQWDTAHEITARLLFMVIRWIKSLPTFRTLSKKDQISLLEDSWKELFLINMAQWSVTFDLVSPATLSGSPSYLSRVLSHQKGLASESPAVSADVQYIQEIMRRFRQLSPDGTECSCLKAVILFKPETLGLIDVQPVEMLQDQAQCILSDYVRHKHPRQATRFGRFLLLLPCIRSIAASTVEKLFFRDTIGDIPIEKLLADMYNMEKFD